MTDIDFPGREGERGRETGILSDLFRKTPTTRTSRSIRYRKSKISTESGKCAFASVFLRQILPVVKAKPKLQVFQIILELSAILVIDFTRREQ